MTTLYTIFSTSNPSMVHQRLSYFYLRASIRGIRCFIGNLIDYLAQKNFYLQSDVLCFPGLKCLRFHCLACLPSHGKVFVICNVRICIVLSCYHPIRKYNFLEKKG